MRHTRLAALLGCLLATTASASILVVDDNGLDCADSQFTTIGAAVDAAKAGDTVVICAGTYPEQVVVTKRLRIHGEPSGVTRPVIRPATLPATRPSIRSGNPIAAAIIVDAPQVTIENLDVDLGANPLSSCHPYLVGIYLRNAAGTVRFTAVHDLRVPTNPACDSGIGLLVESDSTSGPRMRVFTQQNEFRRYQKAGVVALGPRVFLKDRLSTATGSGLVGGAVQVGFQTAEGTLAYLRGSTATDHSTSVIGKMAAGLLVYGTPNVTIRRTITSNGQTGLFLVGDGLKVKGNTISNMTDGIVLLGDGASMYSNTFETMHTDAVFANGSGNKVRGGQITDAPVGVWFYGDPGTLGNLTGSVGYTNVGTEVQGVAGGLRDVTFDTAAPFLPRCQTDVDCNDGSPCTTAVCDTPTGQCQVTASCDDNDPCTNDVCDAQTGCSHVFNTAPCDDGRLCTTNDRCEAGACIGGPPPECVDTDPCTIDGCSDTSGCVHLQKCVDANTCTANLCDSITGACSFPTEQDGTPCGSGLFCTGGVCGP
ncbi:MAG: right-handed parallel beta-helix repeat-containing protein [Candidatus Binatia bacterium]